MTQLPRGRAWTLKLIANTNDRFSGFAPFVPSINNSGTVAFQAALRKGGSGVFTGDGVGISTIADSISCDLASIDSHPDFNSHNSLSFYARLKSGSPGVILSSDGE